MIIKIKLSKTGPAAVLKLKMVSKTLKKLHPRSVLETVTAYKIVSRSRIMMIYISQLH